MIRNATIRSACGGVLCALCVLGLSASAADADTTENTSPVDGALSDSVWFDADLDKVVPVHVQPIVDDSLNRDSRWLPKAQRVEAPAPTTAGGGGGGSGILGSSLTIANLFGWLLLIAIVAAAVGTFAYAISKTEVDLSGTAKSKSSNLSNLPNNESKD